MSASMTPSIAQPLETHPLYSGVTTDTLIVRDGQGRDTGERIAQGVRVAVWREGSVLGRRELRAFIVSLMDTVQRNIAAFYVQRYSNVGFYLAWPVQGQPHRIGQRFGDNPQNYSKFGLPGHEGVDLYAPTGSLVVAAYRGTVKLAAMAQTDYPVGPAYGNQVRVVHTIAGYETIYAHLQDITVGKGQMVEAGDPLGHADNTGNSFGSHLHLTLKRLGATASGYRDSKGRAWPHDIVDPMPFLVVP